MDSAPEIKTPAERAREPMQLGSCAVQFVPHYLPGVGARVFLIISDREIHKSINLSADDARRIADRLKIAACQAESYERRKRGGRAA